MNERVKFLRAKSDPNGPDYEPGTDDTEGMAFGVLMVGLNGWLECAACGDPNPSDNGWSGGGIVTTPSGCMYAYALCPQCRAALSEERGPSSGAAPNSVFSAPAPMKKGRVGGRLDCELDAFIASGEPTPAGW